MSLNTTQNEKAEILRGIETAFGEAVLDSVNWGKIEAWNFIECNRQNAETDGVGEVERMECILSDESDSVGEFFRYHGFNF